MAEHHLVSVVIVDYKAGKLAKSLGEKLARNKQFEVVIIDNNKENRGYSGGLNYGAKKSHGEFLLFTNPDIFLASEDALQLVKVLKGNSEIGLVGPQILDESGKVQITCSAIPTLLMALVEYSFLRNLWFGKEMTRKYRLDNFNHLSSREVPSVSGSCFMMRRSDYENLGGFDESLFLYFEEFDIAKRLQKLHKLTYFWIGAKAIHIGQASTSQSQSINNTFKQSRTYWLQKYYGLRGSLVANLLQLFEVTV